MHQELENMFNNLGVKSPVYTNDEVRVRKGLPYVRYKILIDSMGLVEDPIMFYGRLCSL
jgi:hypothetical protein